MKKDRIIEKARAYVRNIPTRKFIPNKTYIPPSGKIMDEDDVASMMDAIFDLWLTEGRFAKQFEKDLIFEFKNTIRHVALCNSGSSANLLSVSTITAPEFGDRAAKVGDEIITVAAGFPTTVNPIIQNGLIPVFVDVDLETFLPDPKVIENAIGPKTKGIMLAHPLGNCFDIELLRDIADEYEIWLIEDCCDGLGGTFHNKLVGSAGDLATLSFYPAHQITAGEGGAVLIQSPMVKKVLESYRDWGRSCWCDTGKENTCGKRFEWEEGDLPKGYDHKYIYSRIGYNLKITDLQAAMLVSQLKKLHSFTEKRKYNWKRLYDGLEKHRKYFHFMKKLDEADPSWFGFAITIRETAPFTRKEFIAFLESKQIGSRLMFGGNLTKQPAYQNVKYRVFGNLFNTDTIMRDSLWIGCWPGLDEERIDYMIGSVSEFVGNYA